MYNTDKPTREELPTSAQLIKSTLVAIFAAAVLLITVVLPSEYGIDPTGIGRMLGLKDMGEIKTQLAQEAEEDAKRQVAVVEAAPQAEPMQLMKPVKSVQAAEPKPEPQVQIMAQAQVATAPKPEPKPEPAAPAPKDVFEMVLTPGQGTEVKLVMDAGAVATFEWTANGAVLNHDTHGDGGGRSISYEKGRGIDMQKGELKAAFTGNHGWFWRNRTGSDVTLTLKAWGDYKELKHFK